MTVNHTANPESSAPAAFPPVEPGQTWYTCTPVAFPGDQSFFCRDSGAFCKAFQSIGVTSKAVMPLPAHPGDWQNDLIRTSYANLCSADWWAAQHIHGVVLYAWGLGKYTPVARAIRQAGIFLVVYMDSCGLYYPWHHWATITRHMWTYERYHHGNLLGSIRALLRIAKNHTLGVIDYGRRRHWAQAHVLTFPLPQAIDSIRNLRWFYGSAVCQKLALIPTPVSAVHSTAATSASPAPSQEKENLVITVARWDDAHPKNPALMMQTVELFANQVPDWQVAIFGKTTPQLLAWHAALPAHLQARITVHGVVPNAELARAYAKAKISLCTSRHESTHIASTEALCAGASVVGVHSIPLLNCLQWYVSHDSGTLAADPTPQSLCSALIEESREWLANRRNPAQIAAHWSNLLIAQNSCHRLLQLYRNHLNQQ